MAAGMTIPCLVAWALGSLPMEHRGRGMGLWSTSFFIGQFVSPLVVSLLRSLTGGLLPAVATFGGICLVTAVISFLLSRHHTTESQ
jgi:MFS family permease